MDHERGCMCSGNIGWLTDWMDDSTIAKQKLIL